MNPEPEEYALALRARDGDAEALADLVERTRLRLFSLAYAELRHYDDAHDAVAAALLMVCRHVAELREPERVHAWMNSILRNECRRLRQRRDTSALPLEEADGAAEEGPSPLRLDIERALRRLPAEEARAIRLFYLAELPIPEIARRIGRPEGTIKSWLHRGRRHLAGQMEGYAPMARKPKLPATPAAAATQVATLLHTDLDADTVRRLSEALAAVGYEPRVLVPTDLAALPEQLKGTQLLVVDEWLSGRSTIELLIHLKSDPEMEGVPVCVLSSDPSDFTVSAFWGAGVDRLVNKKNAADMARLEDAFRFAYFSWRRFTERARWAFFQAQEASAFLGSPAIDTEHLLLGVACGADSTAARLLERFRVDQDTIRTALGADVLRAPGPVPIEARLTPGAQRAIALARKEAQASKQRHIGTEHLLLGLIAEGSGLAARVLAGCGMDAERTRAALQSGEFAPATPSGEQREGRAGTPWELFTTLDLGRPLPAPEELPTTVPLLACRDRVYFPRMTFPLFVGRPKTVQALKEAEASKQPVIIVCQKDMHVDDPQPDDLYGVGVVARVLHLLELPDESIRVMLEGIARARIVEYLQLSPFIEVRVQPIADETATGEEAEAVVRRVGTEFRADLGSRVPHALFAELMRQSEPGRLGDLLTPYLPLRTADQQVVLEALSPIDRLETVIKYLAGLQAGTLETREPGVPAERQGPAPWWQFVTATMLNAPLPDPSAIPATMPLLAIRDKVYFPRMQFPLFVGREKSVRALKEAEASDRLMLLVAQKQMRTDDPQPDDLFTMGAVVRLLQMLPLPDGTVRVMVEGVARARIREYLQTNGYLQVRVEVLPEKSDATASALVRRLQTEFQAELSAQIPHDHFDEIMRLEEPGRLADLITPHLPLSIENQQAVLETASPTERLERILQHLTAVRNMGLGRAVLLGEPPPEPPKPHEEK